MQDHKGNSKPDKYSVKVNFGVEVPECIKVSAALYIRGKK